MDQGYLRAYEDFERGHWWFVVRRRIIHDAIARCLRRPAPGAGRLGHGPRAAGVDPRWLDIGCGTGVLLESYAAIRTKIGIELDPSSVLFAQAKGLDVRDAARLGCSDGAACGAPWNLSSLGRFDLITMTDVLEHLRDDRAALAAAAGALTPGGYLLITVPALPWLWSGHDVVNHHYRRYTRQSLLKRVDRGLFEVLKLTYFSTFLLPGIVAARAISRARQSLGPAANPSHDFRFTRLDWVWRWVFERERRWVARGRLGLGSSLLLVARRR